VWASVAPGEAKTASALEGQQMAAQVQVPVKDASLEVDTVVDEADQHVGVHKPDQNGQTEQQVVVEADEHEPRQNGQADQQG